MKNFTMMLAAVCATTMCFAQNANNSLLYKITGNNSKPSYLFGTMHVLCANDFKMSGLIKKAFDETKVLCLEINLNDNQALMSAMGLMQMKGDTTLMQLLGDEKFNEADSIYKKYTGISLKMMNKMLPLLSISAIYPGLTGCASEGVELLLMNAAREQQKSFAGLETFEEQINLINVIPYHIQAKMLASTLMNADSSKISYNLLREAYLKGDLEEIKTLSKSSTGFDEYEDALLINRNKNWIKSIENMIQKDPVFVAVGAAHLSGDFGVIELLRKKGYEVTPVQ